MLLIPFPGRIVNVETDIPQLTLYYILYLFNTVASCLVVNKTIVLVADQRGYVTARLGSILNIAQNVALALFLWWTHSFLAYLIIQIAFTYAYNIILSVIASRRYPYINNDVRLDQEETKGIFLTIRSAFIYKSSNLLISSSGLTTISILDLCLV